jgi:hypothetical protein
LHGIAPEPGALIGGEQTQGLFEQGHGAIVQASALPAHRLGGAARLEVAGRLDEQASGGEDLAGITVG